MLTILVAGMVQAQEFNFECESCSRILTIQDGLTLDGLPGAFTIKIVGALDTSDGCEVGALTGIREGGADLFYNGRSSCDGTEDRLLSFYYDIVFTDLLERKTTVVSGALHPSGCQNVKITVDSHSSITL